MEDQFKVIQISLQQGIIIEDSIEAQNQCNRIIAVYHKYKNIIVINNNNHDNYDTAIDVFSKYYSVNEIADATILKSDAFIIDSWDKLIATH